MAVGDIDLVKTAQVVFAATVVVHFAFLRPWTARADLLLTVEMVDKDLTAEIDRGALPADDPAVVDLQRCLSLSRKRSDANESITNVLALLSPGRGAQPWQWPPNDGADQQDRLHQLTPAEQNIVLEYSAELSAAAAAYLRIARPPKAVGTQLQGSRGSRLLLFNGLREGVRHANDVRRGWHLPRQQIRTVPRSLSAGPVATEPEEPRILDLSSAEGDPPHVTGGLPASTAPTADDQADSDAGGSGGGFGGSLVRTIDDGIDGLRIVDAVEKTGAPETADGLDGLSIRTTSMAENAASTEPAEPDAAPTEAGAMTESVAEALAKALAEAATETVAEATAETVAEATATAEAQAEDSLPDPVTGDTIDAFIEAVSNAERHPKRRHDRRPLDHTSLDRQELNRLMSGNASHQDPS